MDIHPVRLAPPYGKYTNHHLQSEVQGLIIRADGRFETLRSLDFVSAEPSRIFGEFSLPIIYNVAAVYIISTIGPAYSCLVLPRSALHMKQSNPHWFPYYTMDTHDQTGVKRTRGKTISCQPESHVATVMNGQPSTGLSGSREACDECRIRKVRCNKEYPKCSSCRKSNLACGFSNKGKRVNHTKKLLVFRVD
jgi:hypothetical protein